MATAAKKNPRRKKPARGKAPAKQTTAAHKEAKLLILAAVGILLTLSIYIEGLIGAVGIFLSRIFIGLFGFGAYVMPLAVVIIAVYGLFSSEKKISFVILMHGVFLLWAIMSFLHIISVPMQEGLSLWTYVQLLYAQGAVSNGGLLGGLLGNALRGFLGAGAYIVLVISGIISFVMITGRSFSQALEKIWNVTSSRLRHEDYDDDFEDDYQEETIPPKASARLLKPLPERSINRKKVKSRGNILDISEAVQQQEGKILLFHEEISHDRAYGNSKILPFKAPDKATGLTENSVKVHFGNSTDTAVDRNTIDNDIIDSNINEPNENSEENNENDEKPLFGPNLILDSDDSGNLNITVKGLVDGKDDYRAHTAEASIPEAQLEMANHSADSNRPALTTVPPIAKPSMPEAKEIKEAAFDTLPRYENYQFPPLDLLNKSKSNNPTESRTQILENSRILEETLRSFKVEAKVIEVSVGPTVTRYDMAPGPGVKVATIANLSNDLALSLAAQGIRIEAPIPGKSAVGIEIPNKDPQTVLLRDILEDQVFEKFPSSVAFGVGKDIAGSPVVTDVARMPHLLIAGATGAGKSVCINTLILSILYKAHPDEVKLLMVDPKVVELSMYNGIPHLLVPVVTDPKKASDALQWAVSEMEQRYVRFAEAGVRDLKGYNHYAAFEADPEEDTIPQIVIIIDELADLMMTCKGAVEESICRLAQKARAAGIHMVLATQRPSVDVITGLIKANIPSRLAFSVSSGTDSRTVLDQTGAEKLLGKGDMLFLPVGQNKPTRLQGGFVSDREVESVVDFLKAQTLTVYPEELVEQVTSFSANRTDDENLDEFFYEAAEFLIEKGKGSTSMLQRKFRIGYNRASRLMEDLETRGIVGPEDGVKPRKILITWEQYQSEYGR